MKRALVLLSLAAGTLSGCATAGLQEAQTLRADLYGDRDGPRVRLSEPAYVAIFQVDANDGGAWLVYPEPGAQQEPLRSGTRSLSAATGAGKLGRYGSTAVLYMVASREPLDLSSFATTRDARSALGAVAMRKDAYAVVGVLAQAVVPDPESAGWTDSMLRSDGAPAARNRSLRRIDHCGADAARMYRTPQSCTSR